MGVWWKYDGFENDMKHKGEKALNDTAPKHWIAGAIKHPGALHKELGVAQGKKIPAAKLNAAAKKGGVEGRRARFAKELKGFNH